MLIPVIGIVQVGSQAMADRYAYMPCIGLFIMIAWGLNQAASNVPTLPRFVPAMASLCLVAAFATATTYYLQYWQNGVLLLTRASVVAGQPNNFIEKTLGDSMSFDGRYDEAFLHYKNACILRPYDSVCHFNMAKLLSGRNQFQEALDQYQIAGTYTNSKDMALVCLINSAEILLGLGDYETAEMKVGAALQIDPTNSNALQLRQAVINLSNNTSHLSH
jgi:tetratricopeptide (TPR) repeat protein